MSLTEARAEGAAKMTSVDVGSVSDFKFVPKYLAGKCQQLIETYHAMRGYACLPDMLWDVELRDLIETHNELRQIFRKASTTRSAKRAKDGFVLIATVILSLEVLASDYAGWGRRFPWAKRKAELFRGERLIGSRTRLMDLYLYPQRYINPAFINALAPPERPRSGDREDAPGGRSARGTAVAESKCADPISEDLGWPSVVAPAANRV
jgi:hypothetical protein